MLSMHGKDSDFEGFCFYLAEKLGRTVADLDDLTLAEFEGWQAYFEAKGSFSSMKKGM